MSIHENITHRWTTIILILVTLHLVGIHLALGLRWEHIAGNALLVGLALCGVRGRHFTQLVLPLWLTGVAYEAFHFFEPLRGPIRVDELYFLELNWFGIQTENGVTLTPAAFLQQYTHPVLDFITGLAYIVYLILPVVIAFALFFIDKRRMAQLTWSIFLVSLMGMATYLAYPAAPPWYVDAYGLGPAQLDAAPDPAGAARFDALIGVPFFEGFYSRSSNVFGAMPSLHVAFPAVLAASVWGLGMKWGLSTLAFALLVGFSAVYLNHHYLWDLIVGYGYAILAWLLVSFLLSVHGKWRAGAPPPGGAGHEFEQTETDTG